MTYRQLRHRVTFQTEEQAPDGSGGLASTWRDVATVWAAFTPVSASEVTESRQQQQRRLGDIRVRHNATLEDCRRLRHDNRNYRILTVQDPDGQGRWLLLRVEEEVHD
ncbi:phage head closure protein [Emcibacter nanhaiensis]|uniref:Head-tail adaptor protein n=1 Tax=Emcibacter nanhaiensis TaxID=1505037 RepID=A0A501PCL1_9PROT|nr:phage head closure protein [Emcibacter nanhaiensis]TPD57747.1 head-tail adaptor protein [Emcibacter nanhaiensis]